MASRSISIGKYIVAPGAAPTAIPEAAWTAQASQFEAAGAIRRLNSSPKDGCWLVVAGAAGKTLRPKPVKPKVQSRAPKVGAAPEPG